MINESGPAHILWTGGWDSTFRLLDLLIRQKRTVQPHYIIDSDRSGTGEELLVRNKIVAELFSRFPETKSRLCPTIFFDNTELPDMPEVTESFRRLRQRVWFTSAAKSRMRQVVDALGASYACRSERRRCRVLQSPVVVAVQPAPARSPFGDAGRLRLLL